MMRKVLFAVIILSLVAGSSYAAGVGTTGAQFLRLDMSARITAMGGAGVAVADGAYTQYINPAGLSCLESREVATNLMSLSNGIGCYNVNYTESVGKKGTFGIGAIYLSSGEMDRTEITAGGALTATTEKFTTGDGAILFSYGRNIEIKENKAAEEVLYNVGIGANLKFISSRIERETSNAAAMDLGVMLKGKGKAQFGVVVQNLVRTNISYNPGQEAALPLSVNLGTAIKAMDDALLVAIDLNLPVAGYVSLALGGEYLIKSDKTNFAVRLGYNTTTMAETNLGFVSGISAGFGVMLEKGVGIDYGFSPSGVLGATHKIGLRYKM